jgi:signal peptidase II
MLARKSWVVMSLVVLVVIVLDQLSKIAILENISHGENLQIIPGFFSLTLTFNPGVAFGMLADVPDGLRHLLLSFVILLALLIVLYMLFKDYRENLTGQVALALISGGAIGNIIDRLRFGKVVDFLLVYYRQYQWPAFNIADSAICVGVTILVVLSIFVRNTSPGRAASDGPGLMSAWCWARGNLPSHRLFLCCKLCQYSSGRES